MKKLTWIQKIVRICLNGNFVFREDCHQAQDTIKEFVRDRLDSIEKHMDDRFEDIKDFFLKNGRR